jgi:hypothetical protein
MANKNYHPTLVTYNKLGLNIILTLYTYMNMNDDMKCVNLFSNGIVPILEA